LLLYLPLWPWEIPLELDDAGQKAGNSGAGIALHFTGTEPIPTDILEWSGRNKGKQ
jgi:hypothetical protein